MAGKRSITNTRVDALKPGESIWDSQLLGFGVRRQQRAPVFFVKFRSNGRQRWLTIGRYGPLTIDQARRKAKAALGAVAEGRDPAAELAKVKATPSVSELCDLYLDAVARMPARHGRPKNAASIAIERGRINRHIRPLLGRLKVTEVTRAHIEGFQEQVAAGRTKADIKTRPRGRAIVRGGNGTAARTLNLVAALFRFAIKLGLRENNPTHGVVRFAWQGATTYLNREQMAALGSALQNLNDRFPTAVAMVRLLALTGARRGEIVGLRWSYVDYHHRVLRLPTSKTGQRLIILGTTALDLLGTLPRSDDSDFIFPGERSGAFQGLPKSWERIRSAAGVDARLHDLRHHYASLAGELGYQLPTISALLGHRLPGTTGGYIHSSDTALREAANRISAAVNTRFEGRSDDVLGM